MSRRFLFLTSSARAEGNALRLARLAAAGVAQAEWIDLVALDLPPFRDLRPAAPVLDGMMAGLARATLAASDIVMVAPVYWYALPAPAKLMLDHWSGWLDLPELRFAERMRGKRLWLITARADPDPAVAAPVEAMMRQTAVWLGMEFAGALHGIGDAAGDVLGDARAVAQAQGFLLPQGA